MLMKSFCMSERVQPSMRMFNARFFLVLSFLLATVTSASADPVIPANFTFQGSGYGHGVGMSQIGARGQALEGKTAYEILRYYYSYVTIEPVRDDRMMRVNIGHFLTSFSVRTDTPLGQMQIFAGDINDTTSTEAIKVIPAKSNLSFTLLGNLAFPSVISPDGTVEPLPSGTSWTIRWTGTRHLPGVASVVSAKSGTAVTKYRYGQIQIKLVRTTALGYRIEVTNTVRLHDEYLWGIGEVPSSWPLAALQAQAIASRTYALSKAGVIKTGCDCDIYGASQDQTFSGYSKETEATYGKLWKAAVNSTSTDETTGLAILFNSQPISAYFFSSSGGQTESSRDAWGTALPYAMSVPDPWSINPQLNSRYALWIRPIAQAVVASAFGLPDVASIQVAGHRASGTVMKVVGVSRAGKKVTLAGEVFRSRTKLPSTWFDLSVGVQN